MTRVAEVALSTKGRPQPVQPPEDGWSWTALSGLQPARYLITLVSDEGSTSAAASVDDAPGPVIEILQRSSVAWDRQVESLLKTVERQGVMLEAKDKRIEELQGQLATQAQADPMSTVTSVLGAVKALMPAAPARPSLPPTDGQ